MHMHITRVGLKGTNFSMMPTSFPVGSVTYNFALNNILTSSRTFGD